ncbi:MAG: DUF308 domain-containing protein [Paludibacteraceae bacterium]|nr:DUF308 domain-containing protein [Paludibacteraceae bacterium]
MKTSTKIWMCLAGVALVALGVLCIVYPGTTIISLAWTLGLMLFVSGFSTFGVWLSMRAINPFSGMTFLGALLQVIIGLFLVINPAPLAAAIPFVFAFWLLFEGIKMMIDAVHTKPLGFRRWWLLCLAGLVVACGGCYALFYNPASSAQVISWLVGLAIIFDGIGYWIKLIAYLRVEKKLTRLADRLHQALDVEDVAWEDVK